MVKKVPLAAPIRDKQIQKTVIIVIPPGASHGISDIIRDITCCYSVEGAVVVVVSVEKVLLTQVGDEEIEAAVIVVIPPGCGKRKTAVGNDVERCHFGECAGAIVAIKEFILALGRTAICTDQIDETVVVVIAPGTGIGISMIGNDIPRGDFGKRDVGRRLAGPSGEAGSD